LASSTQRPALGWRVALVAWLGYAGLSLQLLAPALSGPIVSDDVLLFVGQRHMEGLSLENLKTILDPTGEPVRVTANWAPVHLLAHQLEFEAFGSPLADPKPYHVVNGLVHGVAALLFAALLVTQGVPQALALLAGLLFLLHPANAETAAWIFQLKTLLALGFGLGALLALRARPLLATGLFGLALLCKPSASAVLPAALVFEWLRVPGPGEPARRMPWLLGWGALLLLYALPEFTAFRNIGEFRGELPLGPSLLQAVAILGRYLVLSLSSLGSSTFHQPTPPASPLDAWFGLGVLALLALALASFDALRGRRLAAGWLALAAAAYLPVAQLFPFRYPMADRYLYFVLPGLLGAAAVALSPWLARSLEPVRARGWRALSPGLLALALVSSALCVGFALRFHQRAAVWGSPERIEADAAAHYPDGIHGQIVLARRRIGAGDLDGAIDAIERARARGHSSPSSFLYDPSFQPLLQEPRYVALLQGMTEAWLARARGLPPRTLSNWMGIGQAELFMGRIDRAREALEEAQALASPAERGGVQQMLAELDRIEAAAEPPAP
jgi:tetratricopeptide (TPR) repeat protein